MNSRCVNANAIMINTYVCMGEVDLRFTGEELDLVWCYNQNWSWLSCAKQKAGLGLDAICPADVTPPLEPAYEQ